MNSGEGGIGLCTILALQLSAAFNIIDHAILLDWLRGLRMGGTVLWWLASFFQSLLLLDGEIPSLVPAMWDTARFGALS